MKVYLLIDDDSDEGRVEGVFSSAELAQKYAGGIQGDHSISEYELDPLKELVENGLTWWCVWFREDCSFSVSKYGWEKPTLVRLDWYYAHISKNSRLRVICQASNKEDAVAIATQDFLMVKERGRWGTDNFEGLM